MNWIMTLTSDALILTFHGQFYFLQTNSPLSVVDFFFSLKQHYVIF